jgi:glycosyltransferase involved in cell wall biosynthesis
MTPAHHATSAKVEKTAIIVMGEDERLNLLLWYWGRRGAPVPMVYDLAKAFQELSRVSPFLSLSRQSELFQETDALGLPGCHVDTYGGAVSALLGTARVPVLRRRLRRFVEDHRIDVALCMMRHLWSGGVFPAMRAAGARVLLMLHDTTPHPGEEYSLWRHHLAWELANTDGLIVLSEHVRSSVIRLFDYPSDRIWLVPLAISPIHSTAPSVRRLPSDRPVRILMFGRILPYKGIALLADAFRLVSQRHRVELYIVGHGDDPALGSLAGRSDVRIDARWIPEREITRILDDCDLVVTPYLEASQSGVIPLGYARGLPAVTTPVGGLVEQVEDGATGIVASNISAEALAEALARMLTNPVLYKHCSRGALAVSGKTSGNAASAKRLLQITRDLITLPRR